MILAGVLEISINLLLVIHVVVSLLLILVVLMQRPKQEGLGAAFGGGMTDSMWGSQTTNVLQKGTVYLGTLFMVLSLVLAILIGNKNYDPALVAKREADAKAAAAGETVPGGDDAATPVTPDTPEPPAPSIKDEVEKAEGTTPPETPAAPSGEAPAPSGETPAPSGAGDGEANEAPAVDETPAPSESSGEGDSAP